VERTGAEALEILARAREAVELGPVGAAAVESEACRAYRSLRDAPEHLAALRPELEALGREGAAAARAYAALLLRALDEAAGRAALESMRGSDEPCQLWPGGCSPVTAWLGETAAYLLGEPFFDPRRATSEAPRRPTPIEESWLRRMLEWLATRW